MKVGDYGRTEEGKIIKIEELEDIYTGLNEFITTIAYFKGGYISVEHIIKSSPNIIDLIEVGDIITTNNLCGEITKIDGNKIYTTCYDGEYCSTSDIKSIVTKEQFESMKYEVN